MDVLYHLVVIRRKTGAGILVQRNKAVLFKDMIFDTENMLSINAYHTFFDQISNLSDSYADERKSLLTHIVSYNLYFVHEHFDLINSIPGVVYLFKAKITFRRSHWKLTIRLKVFQGLVSFECICVASFRVVLCKMNQVFEEGSFPLILQHHVH